MNLGLIRLKCEIGLTLTLFMLRVFANDHHATMPTNHAALIAHFLDRGTYFHALSRLIGDVYKYNKIANRHHPCQFLTGLRSNGLGRSRVKFPLDAVLSAGFAPMNWVERRSDRNFSQAVN
jgi:hypothetical protein